MIETSDYVEPDAVIGLHIEPDAIHVMKKSEYSNMFGDYSSFSDELDKLSEPEIKEDEQ
jgi:spermidine/putrescine transport system ATP-binding protein